jgi:hypothetical protein
MSMASFERTKPWDRWSVQSIEFRQVQLFTKRAPRCRHPNYRQPKCWQSYPKSTKMQLRPILNFDPRGKLWPHVKVVPQGWSLSPRGEVIPWGWSYPLGVKFSARPSIILNSRDCSPLGVNKGVNIPPRGQITPLGPISPLGARGEVKNGPLNPPDIIPSWG